MRNRLDRATAGSTCSDTRLRLLTRQPAWAPAAIRGRPFAMLHILRLGCADRVADSTFALLPPSLAGEVAATVDRPGSWTLQPWDPALLPVHLACLECSAPEEHVLVAPDVYERLVGAPPDGTARHWVRVSWVAAVPLTRVDVRPLDGLPFRNVVASLSEAFRRYPVVTEGDTVIYQGRRFCVDAAWPERTGLALNTDLEVRLLTSDEEPVTRSWPLADGAPVEFTLQPLQYAYWRVAAGHTLRLRCDHGLAVCTALVTDPALPSLSRFRVIEHTHSGQWSGPYDRCVATVVAFIHMESTPQSVVLRCASPPPPLDHPPEGGKLEWDGWEEEPTAPSTQHCLLW